MPLFEASFFDTQKSWLTNGFTTLVGFQGTDLKIAGAVLYPNSSKNFLNHLILIVARRVSQTNACIWFIIRSRLRDWRVAELWPMQLFDLACS